MCGKVEKVCYVHSCFQRFSVEHTEGVHSVKTHADAPRTPTQKRSQNRGQKTPYAPATGEARARSTYQGLVVGSLQRSLHQGVAAGKLKRSVPVVIARAPVGAVLQQEAHSP